jgi:hypothetical protein
MGKKILAVLLTLALVCVIGGLVLAAAEGETVTFEVVSFWFDGEYYEGELVTVTNVISEEWRSFDDLRGWTAFEDIFAFIAEYRVSPDPYDREEAEFYEEMFFPMRVLYTGEPATISVDDISGMWWWWPEGVSEDDILADFEETQNWGYQVELTFTTAGVYLVRFDDDFGMDIEFVYIVVGDGVPKASQTANPSTATVTVNGQAVSFQAYNINDSNYFRLRDIAYALNGTSAQFSVGWDGATNAITLTSGQSYEPVGGELQGASAGPATANRTSSAIILNGNQINPTAFNINDSNYFMLRDLGTALGFGVDWDDATRTILITTQ